MRGRRPIDPWADAWPVGPADAGRLLTLRVNDQIRLTLPEVPSSGYVWTLPEDLVEDQWEGGARDPIAQPYLGLVADTFEPTADPNSGVMGGGGWRHLVLRVNRAGRFSLQLVKRRRWQRNVPPAEVFALDVEASTLGKQG